MSVGRMWMAWFAVIAASVGAGCERYDPKPLTGPAVERALAVPSEDLLRERARSIDNPLLKRPVLIGSPAGLTPEAAAVVAVLASPGVRAIRDRLGLADAQLVQAKILPNPQLDMTADPVTGGNTVGTSAGYLVGLSYDIIALIAHPARVAAAQSQQASVRLDVAWQEWQVAEAAKKAAYDLIALRAQLATAQEVDRRLGDEAALVRRAVDAHQKTLLELAAAESTSQKARADLLVVQASLRHQELTLNQALGSMATEPVKLQPVPLPSRLNVHTAEQLLNGLEDRRLDLIALRRGYQAQEELVRAAVLSQFPKLVFNIHQASDTSNVHTTGPGITLDVPIFDRNQGNIAIERATRQRLFDEYVSRVFDARTSIPLILTDIRSVTEQIAEAEASVPALEELVRTYRLAVGQGNADVLSYYTAESDLASLQLNILRLKQQLLQNKVALEIAAGIYLPDDVATTGPATTPATSSPATSPATVPATRPTTNEVLP